MCSARCSVSFYVPEVYLLMFLVQLCMNAWTARRDGKTCPVCRVIIQPGQLQRFTVEDQQKDIPPPPMLNNNEPAPRTRREIRYNKIGTSIGLYSALGRLTGRQILSYSTIFKLWNLSEATAVKSRPLSAISCFYRSLNRVLRVLFSRLGLILYIVSRNLHIGLYVP